MIGHIDVLNWKGPIAVKCKQGSHMAVSCINKGPVLPQSVHKGHAGLEYKQGGYFLSVKTGVLLPWGLNKAGSCCRNLHKQGSYCREV